MTPRLLALMRAEAHLIARLEKLEPRLADDPACWQEYAAIAAALATITPELRPDVVAPLMTQAQLAASLGVSARTVRRRQRKGELPAKRRMITRGNSA